MTYYCSWSANDIFVYKVELSGAKERVTRVSQFAGKDKKVTKLKHMWIM